MDSQATSTVAPAPTAVRSLLLPPLGTPWPEQGGIFAGLMRGIGGGPDVALIIADDPRGHFEDREWGKYGQDVNQADSVENGYANTIAMAEAGSELAQAIRALDIGGFTDWYLPAAAELHLAFATARDHFEQGDYYWTSTQYSPCNAWVQYFENGTSDFGRKDYELRAAAVRRFVL